MHVRPALRSDLSAVAALDREAFGAEAYPPVFFRQALDLWPSLLRVAEDTGRLVGYALAAPAEDGAAAWILATAVRPSSRGRGVATSLLEQILERLRGAGVRDVRLTVHPENAGALRLYHRLGFEIAGDEADYFGSGEPRLVLRLRLRVAPGA